MGTYFIFMLLTDIEDTTILKSMKWPKSHTKLTSHRQCVKYSNIRRPIANSIWQTYGNVWFVKSNIQLHIFDYSCLTKRKCYSLILTPYKFDEIMFTPVICKLFLHFFFLQNFLLKSLNWEMIWGDLFRLLHSINFSCIASLRSFLITIMLSNRRYIEFSIFLILVQLYKLFIRNQQRQVCLLSSELLHSNSDDKLAFVLSIVKRKKGRST